MREKSSEFIASNFFKILNSSYRKDWEDAPQKKEMEPFMGDLEAWGRHSYNRTC